MRNIKRLKKHLLKHYVNEKGTLDLSGLDFSDFDGDVCFNYMKVKKSLIQSLQQVGGDLHQSGNQVKGDLIQNYNKVQGLINQSYQQAEGDLWQRDNEVKGNLVQINNVVKGKINDKVNQ